MNTKHLSLEQENLLYQALKTTIHNMDVEEYQAERKNGFETLPLSYADYGSSFSSKDLKNSTFKVMKLESLPNNILRVVLAEVSSNDVYIYEVFKSNKHMLDSRFKVGETITPYLLRARRNYETKRLRSGREAHKLSSISVKRLLMEKPGPKKE